MRRIAHLSDLHFGTEDPVIVDGLLDDLRSVRPDLAIITGDLTQRARRGQFIAARQFLDQLRVPFVAVPGNHDIPLYNVVARFARPLSGYRRYICEDLQPTFDEGELAVAGVNTARPDLWKDGRVTRRDIDRLRDFFTAHNGAKFKILAAHHPFIPPTRDPSAALVGRAKESLHMLAACGCHLILAGHLHHAYAGDVRPHHVEMERSILVVQAGTAISQRRRDEANAYNVLDIGGLKLRLEVRAWNGEKFDSAERRNYMFHAYQWAEQQESTPG